jgi:hypothetical protein
LMPKGMLPRRELVRAKYEISLPRLPDIRALSSSTEMTARERFMPIRNDSTVAVLCPDCYGVLTAQLKVGNFAVPDLGKIQQLLVTFLLLGIYVFMISTKFDGQGKFEFPTLDSSLVWLMAISHASYLAYRAAPQTN